MKIENKGSFPGLVHDVSASGQTVYIEPSSVVEANNELRILASQEQKEIERICLERPFSQSSCVKRAQRFDMNDRFKEYVALYTGTV